MKTKLIIIMFALILAGCATVKEQNLANISTPANLSVRCPDIPLIVKPTTLGDSLNYITSFQEQYIVCATRFDSLQEITNREIKK